jgi:RimJ/RimL family protein N-acetyltransferase
MHVAVDVPAACRGLLHSAFAYLFRDTGRLLARAEVRAGNSASMRATQHVGFREVSRTRDGWAAGEDLVQFELRREECRWLKEVSHG